MNKKIIATLSAVTILALSSSSFAVTVKGNVGTVKVETNGAKLNFEGSKAKAAEIKVDPGKDVAITADSDAKTNLKETVLSGDLSTSTTSGIKFKDGEKKEEAQKIGVTVGTAKKVDVEAGATIQVPYVLDEAFDDVKVDYGKEVEIKSIKVKGITIEKDAFSELEARGVKVTKDEKGLITLSSAKKITKEHIEKYGDTITVTVQDTEGKDIILTVKLLEKIS